MGKTFRYLLGDYQNHLVGDYYIHTCTYTTDTCQYYNSQLHFLLQARSKDNYHKYTGTGTTPVSGPDMTLGIPLGNTAGNESRRSSSTLDPVDMASSG